MANLSQILCHFRVFKRIDVKGDHKIDFNEFKEALHNQGIFVAPDVEKECFNQMDMDKSGTLDLDEFITSLRVRIDLLINRLIDLLA